MNPNIRNGIVITLAAVVALIVGSLIGDQSYFRLALVAIFVLFLLFIQNPTAVAILCIVFNYSGLTAPGIPGKLNFFYLTALCLLTIMTFQVALKRVGKLPWSKAHTLMGAFAVVLAATILVRGAGFRVLGSGTWGGMFYVQLFICMLLVLALPQAGIPPKWWPRAIFAMGLFSLLPLLADVAILKGLDPGKVWSVVQGSQQIGEAMQAELHVERGVVRYFSAGVAGQLMLIGFLAVVPMNRLLSLRGAWLLPLPLAFLAMTLFGGFRLGLLNFFLIVGLVVLFQRALTLPRILVGCFLLLAAWFAVVKSSPYLPPAAQRAVTWVPGADIPEHVRHDATTTVDWRLQLWREGLKNLPKYWLIGKGYAFGEKEAVAVTGANRATDEIAWAMVTSAYHNGPISLLLGLGVFGLLIGISLMFAICARHWRIMRDKWRHPALRQCHQVIFAMLIVHVAVFLTIYGDVQASFPTLFFMFALLEGLRISDGAIQNSKFKIQNRGT